MIKGKKKKSLRPIKTSRNTETRLRAQHTQLALFGPEDIAGMWSAPIPSRVGSDLSFIEFADEVKPSMFFNILKGCDSASVFHGLTFVRKCQGSLQISSSP